ncbi:MAG: hypothetical protein AAFV80_05700 [Bacteroidota bacterium]
MGTYNCLAVASDHRLKPLTLNTGPAMCNGGTQEQPERPSEQRAMKRSVRAPKKR